MKPKINLRINIKYWIDNTYQLSIKNLYIHTVDGLFWKYTEVKYYMHVKVHVPRCHLIKSAINSPFLSTDIKMQKTFIYMYIYTYILAKEFRKSCFPIFLFFNFEIFDWKSGKNLAKIRQVSDIWPDMIDIRQEPTL